MEPVQMLNMLQLTANANNKTHQIIIFMKVYLIEKNTEMIIKYCNSFWLFSWLMNPQIDE